MLFIESRKRETVWKALQLTRYVLLNMLSELNNKLQKLQHRKEAEAAAQAQDLATAQAEAQAKQAAAQAGLLNQYQEAHSQQNLPPGIKAYQEPAACHSLGGMTVECQHCHALHWGAEKLSTSTLNNKKNWSMLSSGPNQSPSISSSSNSQGPPLWHKSTL